MMLEVSPFNAIRFNTRKLGRDLSSFIAPPYDVLDAADKRVLLRKSSHNIAAIDLPHLPPKSAGPPEAYAGAARGLQQWLSDGVLIRESSPAMYVYHQQFSHAGKTYTRKKLFVRVRLHPFSDGIILPHEQTFGGPKEDRLALMKATRCQLSPIFGLFSDPKGEVDDGLHGIAEHAPDVEATLDGVNNRLWIVNNEAAHRRVATALRDRKIYIADGHHRYGTALLYRDALQDERGAPVPKDHPAQFVMFVLASMDDPGCLILPYYRALESIAIDELLRSWREGVSPCGSTEADLELSDGRDGSARAVRFTNRDVLKSLEPDQVAPWHKLDYAYLHRYLIDELLTRRDGRTVKIHYAKSVDDAIRDARQSNGVALLVKATPMAHLRAVSEAGGLMPQKSTYFHPKLATGMVMNPLE